MDNIKKNIIIGGGITGLVCLEYFSDYSLLESSCELAKDFLDNTLPKYLHFDESIEKFFKKIDFTPVLKEFDISIVLDDREIPFNYEGNDKRDIYELYCMSKYGKVVENKMNGFMNYSPSYYVENKDELINLLFKRNKDRIFVNCPVRKINEKYFYLDDNQYEYNNMISTIHISILRSIKDCERQIECDKIKSTCIKFVLTESCNKRSFSYIISEKYNFNRVTYYDDIVTFEFPDIYDELIEENVNQCITFLQERYLYYISDNIFRNVFYHSKDSLSKLDDILLIGRYAQLDYSLKINDVIKRLEEGLYGR